MACDIRGHIEAALFDAPAPVTAERLRSVLDRLGSPNQWVPSDDLPVWRRVLVELTAGPEDWRLAHLTLALFVSWPLLGPIGPPMWVASILMARAGLALLDEKGEPVGARRWLLYPPLVFIYAGLAVAMFLVAPAAIAGLAGDPSAGGDFVAWLQTTSWLSLALVVALVAGMWWMMLGLTLARFRRAVRWVFWPFANWFERRHGLRIAAGGFIIAALSGGAFAMVF